MMIRNALYLTVFALLLLSCTNKPSTLPDEAYTCQPWPIVPRGTYGDVTLGRYIVDGNHSYNDCKSKLWALKP